MEEIPLDLSKVPTVEQGVADADVRYRGFIQLTKDAFGEGPDTPLFEAHFGFVSFVNRASSLHKGILSAVRDENPHSAFTLLRAYLELVVLVYYLDAHPDYIEALKRPMSELPRGTRKRFSELFEVAGQEIAGVRATYEMLNEMAHFGSTALWTPFTVESESERTITFSTGAHWKGTDDARTVLVMLQEADEAVAETLRRYSAHHVLPYVERYRDRARVMQALVAAGGEEIDSETGQFTLPAELVEEGLAAGFFVHCEEHGVPEIADDVAPEAVEEWLATRVPGGGPADLAGPAASA
jgi:hypothetical protein